MERSMAGKKLCRRAIFFVLLLSCAVATRASPKVWDGVLGAQALSSVRTAALSDSSNGHIWQRGLLAPRTLIESVLGDVLEAIGDDSEYVEYWWREHWMPLGAHRDIDEAFADLVRVSAEDESFTFGAQRCPHFGHILYVSVEPTLLAPTCVFEEVDSGSTEDDTSVDRGGPPRALRRMTIVPAVSGRLLRFPGHWLHAVPQPASQYIGTTEKHSSAGQPSIRVPGSPPRERLTLLFNSWSEPPLPASEDTSYDSPLDEQVRKDFCAMPPAERVTCRPQREWESVDTAEPSGEEQVACRLRVPLMSNKERRGCEAEDLDAIALATSRAALQASFESERVVHSVRLR